MDELNEQEKMDRLIAELTSQADSPDAPEASGGMDQSTIDNLLAGVASDAENETAADPPAEDVEHFDQAALDRLLGNSTAEPKPPAADPPAEDVEHFDQAALDRLLGNRTAEPGSAPATEAPPPEPVGDSDEGQKLLDQSELDDLFNSLYEEKPRAVHVDPGARAETVAMREEAPEPSDPQLDSAVAPQTATGRDSRSEGAVEDDPAAAPDTPLPASEVEAARTAADPGIEGFSPPETPETTDLLPAGRVAHRETPPQDEPSGPPVETMPAPERLARRSRPLSPVRPHRKHTGALAAIFLAVLAIGGIGTWWHTHRRPPEPVIETVVPKVAPVSATIAAPAPEPPMAAAEESLDGLLNQIDRLREAYRIKHEEIVALQDHYRSAIAVIEDEIRAAADGRHDFKQAVENKRIELGLKTIQRQRAYIEKLEESVRGLKIGSEELRFVRREIQTDARIVPFAPSVTLDRLAEKARETLRRYTLTPEKTSVDLSAIPLASLEVIWQALAVTPRALSAPAVAPPKITSTAIGNPDIAGEICRGQFDNKHRLTELSPETAGCLAAWKGKDLFLNHLTRLSVQSASRLAAWKGEWLGLNGLTEISEGVAAELARWPGRRLSLNGITILPSAAVARLALWPGRDLELAGLQALSPEAAAHLARWRNAGGKVMVSEHFRWPQIVAAQ